MSNAIHLHYEVSGEDFTRAGEASGAVKKRLKSLGFNSDAIRRVAIAMYEAEINMVIHADGGYCDVDIYPDRIEILLADHGPGIADVDKAMQEGFENIGFSTERKGSDLQSFGSLLGSDEELPEEQELTKEQLKTLLEVMREAGVDSEVFKSTIKNYG